MSKFNPETENWKPEKRKQMLSKEDKNEIIEMFRCPVCGGAKYVSHPLVANNTEGKISVSYFPTGCSTCNGTGIRLPEKSEQVTEQVEKSCNFIRTGKGCHDCVNQIPAHLNDGNYCGIDMAQECPENMFSHYEEKSCGNCRFEPLAENSPCNFCDDFEEMWNWQPKEQSEISESEQNILKLYAKSLVATLDSANELAEKDKEIEELKAERDKFKELLADVADNDICEYDHHGYCQTHGLRTRPCVHERIKQALGEG